MPDKANVTTQDQEKDALVKKRLLLAKMMYEHGREHSEKPDPLGKMLAIHHFHNAVEITLKCIMLHFDIRAERELNIEFERLLNEINDLEQFKEAKKKLPLRREMRILNEQRNLVQHAAQEPAQSVLEESRVFSHRFLERVLDEYFGLDYDELSARSLIQNNDIREALDIAAECLAGDNVSPENCLRSVMICKLTYEVVRSEVERYITGHRLNPFFEVSSELRDYRDIGRPLAKLMDRTNEICKWVTLLASGVDLAESRKFDGLTPIIHFSIGGHYHAQSRPNSTFTIANEEARWVLGFTTRVLFKWQSSGFAIEWPNRLAASLEEIRSGTIEARVIQCRLQFKRHAQDTGK